MSMEKNELPQTVKLVYNAELNCMVDVADNRYVQGIDSGVEYRKVGEENSWAEEISRQYLGKLFNDKIENVTS